MRAEASCLRAVRGQAEPYRCSESASPGQAGLEEGFPSSLHVGDGHFFGANFHICEATQGVLGSIVKAQVVVGDLALVSHRGVHEVAGPTQHIAHSVFILKILRAEDARLVTPALLGDDQGLHRDLP